MVTEIPRATANGKKEPLSRSTRLLEKRNETLEVQLALDTEKEQFSSFEETAKKREEDLRRRNRELQDSLAKFNRFLQARFSVEFTN